MLNRITASNFRSLGPNVDLQLNRFTALVGQNGSGKSNVVDIVRFVADAMTLGLEGAITRRHGISAVRRWTSGHPVNLKIGLELKLADAWATYEFELTSHSVHDYAVKHERAYIKGVSSSVEFEIADARWVRGPTDLRPSVGPLNLALPLVAGDERFRALGDALRSMAVYTIFPDVLREPQKYDPKKPMEQHGANWISILKDQKPESWQPELAAALGKLTGEIDAIEVRPVAGHLFIRFRHGVWGRSERPKWFDAAQESDGTLRIAGIVTALLQEPRLSLIGIEEPELTIHPGAIRLVYDYLRQAADHTQVLVTTHSPELLDLLDPDDVRVVDRHKGVTRVAQLEMRQKQEVKAGLLTLGDAHRAEGLRPEQLKLPFSRSATEPAEE